MMDTTNTFTLVNAQNGNLAFKVFHFENNSFFDHLQHNNYYSLIWLFEGKGQIKADFSTYDFESNYLFSFSPYQPFIVFPSTSIKGVAVQFHPDFFCIHKHQHEVACNGVLFNNIYKPPLIKIDEKSAEIFRTLLQQMKAEMQQNGLAQSEMLVSYLKIFLIAASRLKTEQHDTAKEVLTKAKEPFVLQKLKDAIEDNFKEKHSAGDYSEILNISSKALAKITKTHLNKTLTSLISERIIIEAKRELYLTNKPVKQIAYELGYEDEYYFSRFFKINTDISPQFYRDAVGFARGGID